MKCIVCIKSGPLYRIALLIIIKTYSRIVPVPVIFFEDAQTSIRIYGSYFFKGACISKVAQPETYCIILTSNACRIDQRISLEKQGKADRIFFDRLGKN